MITIAASRSVDVVLGRFLDEVQSFSGVNKMTVQNLATVFGPNILRPKVEDPVAIMEGQCSSCIFP